MRRFLIAVTLGVVAACSPIDPLIILPTGRPSPRDQFQVWAGDSVYLLQQVQVVHDTLFGTQYESRAAAPPRIAIPVSAIDSLRKMYPEGGSNTGLALWAILMTTILAAFVFLRAGA